MGGGEGTGAGSGAGAGLVAGQEQPAARGNRQITVRIKDISLIWCNDSSDMLPYCQICNSRYITSMYTSETDLKRLKTPVQVTLSFIYHWVQIR